MAKFNTLSGGKVKKCKARYGGEKRYATTLSGLYQSIVRHRRADMHRHLALADRRFAATSLADLDAPTSVPVEVCPCTGESKPVNGTTYTDAIIITYRNGKIASARYQF